MTKYADMFARKTVTDTLELCRKSGQLTLEPEMEVQMQDTLEKMEAWTADLLDRTYTPEELEMSWKMSQNEDYVQRTANYTIAFQKEFLFRLFGVEI